MKVRCFCNSWLPARSARTDNTCMLKSRGLFPNSDLHVIFPLFWLPGTAQKPFHLTRKNYLFYGARQILENSQQLNNQLGYRWTQFFTWNANYILNWSSPNKSFFGNLYADFFLYTHKNHCPARSQRNRQAQTSKYSFLMSYLCYSDNKCA